MNEHDNTDDLLKRMGEAHQRYSPNVDENALLMRALARCKPRNLALSLLMGLLPPLLFFAIIIQPWWPVLGSKAYSLYDPISWTVAGVDVKPYTRKDVFPNSFFKDDKTIFYRCDSGDKEIIIVEPPDSMLGFDFVAFYEDEDTGLDYILIPSDETFSDPTPYTQMQAYTAPATDIAAQMLKAKLWPSRLWKLKPFVRQLAHNQLMLVRPGPLKQRVDPAEIFVGDEKMYYLEGNNLSGLRSRVRVRAMVWPNHYVISAPYMALVGDETGYVAYQHNRYWGNSVDLTIDAIKDSIQDYVRQLPACEPEVAQHYSGRLIEVNKQVQEGEPSSLLRYDDAEIYLFMKPWVYQNLNPSDLKDRYLTTKKSFAAVYTELSKKPVDVAGAIIERSTGMYGFAITKGTTSLKFNYSWAQTEIMVEKDGKAVCLLDVHNYSQYPVLQHRFDAATEEALTEVTSIAADMLIIQKNLLPGDEKPTQLLRHWLEALASRSFVLKTTPPTSYLDTEIQYKADNAVLVMSVADNWESNTGIDLMIEPDGFQFFSAASSSLLVSENGQLSLERRGGSTAEPFSKDELRQLRGCLTILDAALPSVGVPMDKGMAALSSYLADPVLPKAQLVDELPIPAWSWSARTERNKAIYPPKA